MRRYQVVEHNWYAHCAKCGKVQRKMDMKKLYASVGTSCPVPKILCHLCQSCFCALLDELEVSM